MEYENSSPNTANQICLPLEPPTGELTRKDFSKIDPVGRRNCYEDELDKYTHLNVQLHCAQPGFYGGQPATLLIFQFIFQHRSGSKRIKAVNIEVRFRSEKNLATSSSTPYVVDLAPKLCDTTDREIFGEEVIDVDTMANPSTNNQSGTIARKFSMSIQGAVRSTDGGNCDRVVWDCEETRKKRKGVPRRCLGGVIVVCGERFSALFDIEVTLGSIIPKLRLQYQNLIGRGESYPIIIDPSMPVGGPVSHTDEFKYVDLEELIQLDAVSVHQVKPVVITEGEAKTQVDHLPTPSPSNFNSEISQYYKEVLAILIYWEDDDLGCSKEVKKVQDMFQRLFHYQTKLLIIPQSSPQAWLQRSLSELIAQNTSKSTLIIVYYAGHGDSDGSSERLGKLLWAANKQGGPTLIWSNIQPMLFGIDSDVLLILDCCHAALAMKTLHESSGEILAACARNLRTDAVGRTSFTSALLSELKRVARSTPHSGITVEKLFRWLSTDVSGLIENAVHIGGSKGYYGWGSILLRPISRESP